MKNTKMFLVACTLLMVILGACSTFTGLLPTPTATLPPTLTLSPTPAQTSTPTPTVPKEGKWKGDNVSFTVSSLSQIIDFAITLDWGAGTTCEISSASMDINADAKFVLKQDYDLSAETNAAAKFIKSLIGEKGTLDIVSGEFTSSIDAIGNISDIYFCDTQVHMGDNPNSAWEAQWIGP